MLWSEAIRRRWKCKRRRNWWRPHPIFVNNAHSFRMQYDIRSRKHVRRRVRWDEINNWEKLKWILSERSKAERRMEMRERGRYWTMSTQCWLWESSTSKSKNIHFNFHISSGISSQYSNIFIYISNNCESVVEMSANDEQWMMCWNADIECTDFYSSASPSSCDYYYFLPQLCWHTSRCSHVNVRTPSTTLHKYCTWFYRNTKVQRMSRTKRYSVSDETDTTRNATDSMRLDGYRMLELRTSFNGPPRDKGSSFLLNSEYAFIWV